MQRRHDQNRGAVDRVELGDLLATDRAGRGCPYPLSTESEMTQSTAPSAAGGHTCVEHPIGRPLSGHGCDCRDRSGSEVDFRLDGQRRGWRSGLGRGASQHHRWPARRHQHMALGASVVSLRDLANAVLRPGDSSSRDRPDSSSRTVGETKRATGEAFGRSLCLFPVGTHRRLRGSRHSRQLQPCTYAELWQWSPTPDYVLPKRLAVGNNTFLSNGAEPHCPVPHNDPSMG